MLVIGENKPEYRTTFRIIGDYTLSGKDLKDFFLEAIPIHLMSD
jgi:hypothetical protein